jgi:hypothetical protein
MKHRGTGKRKGGPKGHDHDALVIDGPPAAARPQGAGPDQTRQDTRKYGQSCPVVLVLKKRQLCCNPKGTEEHVK